MFTSTTAILSEYMGDVFLLFDSLLRLLNLILLSFIKIMKSLEKLANIVKCK